MRPLLISAKMLVVGSLAACAAHRTAPSVVGDDRMKLAERIAHSYAARVQAKCEPDGSARADIKNYRVIKRLAVPEGYRFEVAYIGPVPAGMAILHDSQEVVIGEDALGPILKPTPPPPEDLMAANRLTVLHVGSQLPSERSLDLRGWTLVSFISGSTVVVSASQKGVVRTLVFDRSSLSIISQYEGGPRMKEPPEREAVHRSSSADLDQ